MGGRRGLLIDVEGIDAVGKKTQSASLVSWLRSRGVSTGATSFPDYGTVIGREIRSFLAGDRPYSAEVGHMLYAVNRWEKKPDLDAKLAESDAVVVNRYSASNYAYGVARGLSLDWLVGLEEGLPKAELVLVLDAPAAELAFRRGPNKDSYERNTALQEKVREVYLDLARRMGWTVVDAGQGIRATGAAVGSAVEAAFSARGRTV